MANKMEEGLEHIKAAEKYLKTGMLKWKPDFDSAADEYNQAAQCFRIMRNQQKTMDCYMLASDCYKNNKSFFHAAKCIETAIVVAKDILSPEDVYKMAENSCMLYQQHGSGDSGANVLDKAAKIIEERAPKLALQMFQHAADVSSGETTSHQAAEFISKASRILVKLGMYDQAVECIRREMGYHQQHNTTGPIGRLTVVLVLVHLGRGDCVAAEKAYREWGNNCEHQEAQMLEELLAAYDEGDPIAAKRALANPFIRHMDVEYARLATIVPLPESMSNIPHSTIPPYNPNVQQQSTSAAPPPVAPKAEDEEDEGALC